MSGMPFRRCFRPISGEESYFSHCSYVRHPSYADEPTRYIRSFLLVLNDFKDILNYIEPDSSNNFCYSLKIQQLLTLVCIEIEANMKAIIRDNSEIELPNIGMKIYGKIEISHHLSQFSARLPYWKGDGRIRTPFSGWATGETPAWYLAYNRAKHDRHRSSNLAHFSNLVDAICALSILMSSQFGMEEFSENQETIGWAYEDNPDGFDNSIGRYFSIRYPTNWTENEKYSKLSSSDWEEGNFRRFNYR